jgi:hypothetical protein
MKTEPKYLGQYNRLKLYVLSALAVFVGGIIYILLRPKKALFLETFDNSGISDVINSFREITVPTHRFFPDWFIYTLPNGLWAFAYTLLIFTLWQTHRSGLKYIWFVSIPVLIFGFELMQLAGHIPGTFAFDDILSGFLGITLGILTAKLYPYEKKKV